MTKRSHRRRLARYHEKNPTRETYLIAGLGAALAVGLGYLLYTQSQSSALASGGGGGGGGGSTSGGTTDNVSTQGTFVNSGTGGAIGGGATGSGIQPFDPNAPGYPGPIGPTTTPLGPV